MTNAPMKIEIEANYNYGCKYNVHLQLREYCQILVLSLWHYISSFGTPLYAVQTCNWPNGICIEEVPLYFNLMNSCIPCKQLIVQIIILSRSIQGLQTAVTFLCTVIEVHCGRHSQPHGFLCSCGGIIQTSPQIHQLPSNLHNKCTKITLPNSCKSKF